MGDYARIGTGLGHPCYAMPLNMSEKRLRAEGVVWFFLGEIRRSSIYEFFMNILDYLYEPKVNLNNFRNI